jgi:uncharacterized damage-inducible protein DinB
MLELNGVETARLRELVSRLTDEQLGRSMGHGGWTVASTLAHLAYWDRWTEAKLAEWDAGVVRFPYHDADAINDSMLPQWLAVSPRAAAEEALAAAEAVDHRVETVSAELIQAVMAQRPRMLIRAMHRREHLDEIEHVPK